MMKKILTILICTGAILAIILAVLISKTPLKKLSHIASNMASDSLFITNYPPIYDAAALAEDMHLKALSLALLDQSKSDSIQMLLNIRDSSIHLIIKGVTIHSSKIKISTIDPILYKLTNREYLWLFGNSRDMTQMRTSIIKEPMVVREAPKDTLEAALNAYKPDTLIQNPAMLRFIITEDIVIRMIQEEPLTKWEQKVIDEFENTIFQPSLWKKYKSLFSNQDKNLDSEISLTLPRADLRAIYRALPNNARIVITL